MIEYLMKFTSKKYGHVFYSRHEKPDFVFGMTDEEILDIYIVEKITNKEEIEQNIWR